MGELDDIELNIGREGYQGGHLKKKFSLVFVVYDLVTASRDYCTFKYKLQGCWANSDDFSWKKLGINFRHNSYIFSNFDHINWILVFRNDINEYLEDILGLVYDK